MKSEMKKAALREGRVILLGCAFAFLYLMGSADTNCWHFFFDKIQLIGHGQ